MSANANNKPFADISAYYPYLSYTGMPVPMPCLASYRNGEHEQRLSRKISTKLMYMFEARLKSCPNVFGLKLK